VVKYKKEKIIVTCALPYVNNVPHIGHIAGSHLPGDIFARFCRLRGHEVAFIGGSDEHGTPSAVAAQKIGITPRELCDELYSVHKRVYEWFEISYDNFSRTSREIHHRTTQEFFKRIYENGFIVEKEIVLPYCESCGRTLPDRFVDGTCPNCGYEDARGDQCEKCTKLLSPHELKSPRCTICGKTPIFRKFKHLFLQLDKLEPKIKSWVTEQGHWRKTVSSLALGWINDGLKERCITRDLKWGVKVPLKGYEDKVLYVWFDAPIGYISGTEEWDKNWAGAWKDQKTKIVHFIGKDNIPFHTVWWGGMLLANGDYTLPYNVAGYQFLNYQGGKISKSKGWGIFCEKLPDAGLSPDVWRFYLTELLPESKDSEWKWKEFKEKVNGELVGNLGNFINRVLSFTNNYFKGRVPKAGKLLQNDKEVLDVDYDKFWNLTWDLKLRECLKELLKVSARGNKYFQDEEPWVLIKEDKERCGIVLNTCVRLCRDICILMSPFLPESAEKLAGALGVEIRWDNLGEDSPRTIKKLAPLFPKLDDDRINELRNKVTKPTSLNEFFKGKGVKGLVSIDEFKRLDIRIGTVKSVEPVKGTDKLYKMTVDAGKEVQIVSGIRDFYGAKDLIGMQIAVLVNLEPTSIKGVKSNGMLLAVEDDKELALLTVDKKVKDGIDVH
jgi:methionyl-tRNA synthetase